MHVFRDHCAVAGYVGGFDVTFRLAGSHEPPNGGMIVYTHCFAEVLTRYTACVNNLWFRVKLNPKQSLNPGIMCAGAKPYTISPPTACPGVKP